MGSKKKRSRIRKRRYRKIKRFLSAICIAIIVSGILYLWLLGNEYINNGEMKSRLKDIYYSKQNETILGESDEPQITAEPTAEIAAQPNSGASDSREDEGVGEAAPEESVVSAENVVSEEEAEAEEYILQPEFEELYAQNSDIIGWIKMGTSVDYPILWRDNTYYMDHDFDGNVNSAGAIFLDQRNQPNMSDSAMLIYGHNMKNGSMFGDLDRYRMMDYLREYPVITIRSAWESQPRFYVLISLFDASMNRNDPSYIKIIRTSFEQDEDKIAFIQEMRERSMFEIDLEANAQDQLLTLVTCSYTHDNGRFLLFARELREEENEEDVIELFKGMDLKN